GGKGDGPPARHQQQPRADRPVEARQPQIGPRPGGGDAVDPIAGRIGDAARAAGHCESGLPVSVSKVDDPFFVAEASGTVGVAPGASLKVGPGSRCPCAAASQTCLPTCWALLWPSLTCLRTSGGTPQVAPCSCKPLIILVSVERKTLKSLHISSGGAFFWPAACSAWPCLLTSSRVPRSCWQAGGGSCGALNAPPGIAGDIPPDEPGMPGISPNCAPAGQSRTPASANANGRARLSVMTVFPRPPDSTPQILRPRY